MTAVADWISALPALRLSPGEFAALPSHAIHDAIVVYPGTRWKTLEARRGFFPTSAPRWVVGEGVQDGGSHIRITWYRPIITLRAAVAPAEQAPPPIASPAAAPSPPPGQAEGTPPRAPRRRRAYASPVWTPARDDALRRLILTDMPHAAMLAELNAIPAPRDILSIGALRTRINDLGIARPLEVKRELQRRSGQHGAAVLADLTAAGTARRGARPYIWTPERLVIAKRMWGEGAPATEILAAVNATGDAPPVVSVASVRQYAMIHGWVRPEAFKASAAAASRTRIQAENDKRRAARAEAPEPRQPVPAPAPPPPPAPRRAPPPAPMERTAEEEARIADAAVLTRQERVRESLRKLLAEKRDGDFTALAGVAKGHGVALREVLRLMGEVRKEMKA